MTPQHSPRAQTGAVLQQPPVFESPAGAQFELGGLLGRRLQACLEHWWLTAPDANPAMLQMFRDRDRQPPRDLLPWSGEFAGKYLTSAALGWQLTGDARLRRLIDRTVDELALVQDTNGYLGPFPRDERFYGSLRLRDAERQNAIWDLWGHYHILLGLLSWYAQTGYAPALAISRKAADHLCNTFLDGGARVHDTGGGTAEEMNMALSHGLCLLYEQTSDPRYLALARAIEVDWEKPPAGDYVRQALAGRPFYQTPKPRWESLHDIQAIAELYAITGDERYRRAFEATWRSILEGDRHNTGGFSSGEQATGNPYDPRPIETCCTIAWMAITLDMLRMTGDALAADELELSTFNALLGAQSPSGRWWTYNTPMDGLRKASAHDIVFQARAGSPELNCCSVNGPRGLGMLAEWAVMRSGGSGGGVIVNYYGPGTTVVALSRGSLRLAQHTAYPLEGQVTIDLGLEQPQEFPLCLRIPGWSARTTVRVNGEQAPGVRPGSYLCLAREWRNGDRITLDLDMALHGWPGEREAAGKLSLYRGPLLLAYDQRYNECDPPDIPALSPQRLAYTVEEWHGPLAPWLLLRFTAADGRTLRLCDFASAGLAGTEYRSWLPVSEGVPGGLPDNVAKVT